jgi:hypothetical protein
MHTFTEIPDFKLDKETCFICGKPADTKEHLFPKWLQHKFNLWDQKLIIPNQTYISYRQLVVPCCDKCNNEIFSGLENKISTNSETDKDIWRWANKIHFGLTLKDKFLEWDRKHPNYKIGDVISPLDPLEQSRHFLQCVSGDFKCSPDPFGSVFRFIFTSEQEYNFIHIINSSSICISFGDRGYVIFIRDGQYLKDCKGVVDDYEKILNQGDIGMHDMLFFYAKNLEFLERFKVSIPLMVMKGQIVKIGAATIREEKPVNKLLLSKICERFGFTWIDSDTLP